MRGPEDHYIERSRRVRGTFIKPLIPLLLIIVAFAGGIYIGQRHDNVLGIKAPAASASASGQLDYTSVNQVYSVLKKDFDGNLDQSKLTNGLKAGLVTAAGDPYTVFFNPTEAKDFNNQLSGSITGIGAELGTDDQNNIVIISPLSGYPAEKAGLKTKDIVAAVNNKPTQGMTLDGVVKQIRGNPGTQVTLTIVRGTAKPFDVTITRQKITIPSVKYEEDGDIGYLKISQFSNDTVGLAQKAAQEFKSKNVKAVILDLRGDPGGYLESAVGVSSLWLDNGKTIVQEKRGPTLISTEYASGNNTLKGLPTVVLIDGGSASASEITAGALHDNGVAQLVGVKSFGKGSVQQVENFKDGSELKVTIARWYTPAGKNIDKQGITPDVNVSISDQDAAAGKDPQKDKATQILQAKL